jgi:predicted nucleic acid-binding protein
MRLENELRGVSRILLDTAPVVYHLERNPRYAPIMESFFRLRRARGIILVTTPITLSECLVHPFQQRLDGLVDAYHSLIVAGENTVFQGVGAVEAEEAARLRATHNLRLADAYQAAIATVADCQAILTNDRAFARLTQIRALILDDVEF